MDKRTLGSRLRDERTRLTLKQEELGLIGGVNRNTQGSYEKGESNPDTAYLSAVAAVGVDVMYVLTGQRMPMREECLSVAEEKILDNYRSLPEEDQAAVRRLTDALAQSVGKDEVTKKGGM